MFNVYNKDQNHVSDFVLVSLLLNLNVFPSFQLLTLNK